MRQMLEAGQPNEEVHEPVRGTDTSSAVIHNYEDRSARSTSSRTMTCSSATSPACRARAARSRRSRPEKALGNFQERLDALTEERRWPKRKRCMSCGLCFECDNCVVYCPQNAVFRVQEGQSTTGRYVDTDYTKCIGCHICSDVCPTGYIQMGLGE